MLVKINDEFKHTAKWREQLDADKAIQVWQWLFTHQESIKVSYIEMKNKLILKQGLSK